MKNLFVRFVREDEGQDLVEYALLITFIALACIIGMQQLGTAINQKYQAISTSLQNSTGGGGS
jgi:pilus assembly protein Flp/PilA